MGDRGAAGRLLDEAAAITTGLDHYPASMGLLQAQAIKALLEGDLGAAEAASAEGARRSRDVGDPYYLERMLMNLGLVAVAAGDVPLSRSHFIEGLRIAMQTDNRLGQASFLRRLGGQAATSASRARERSCSGPRRPSVLPRASAPRLRSSEGWRA